MTRRPPITDVGVFAIARKNVDDFCQNLYLSYVTNECASQLAKLEEEYNEALLRDDQAEIDQKRLQLQAYQSSLMLTAYMLDEVDEIST